MNEHVVSPSAPSANQRWIDTGLLALVIVGRAHQVDIDAGVLAHELGLGASKAGGDDLVRGARLAGLHARHLTSADVQRLSEVPRPAILRMQDGGYLVLTRMPSGEDGLHDPLDVRPRSTSLEQICETWSGEIVLVTRRSELDEVEKPFGLGWFVESFLRHRKSLINILISSLFIQLFALISPLMFQVVVDKVLVHKSESTLDVIAIALGLMAVFDVSLQYLRSYALFHTASRIDVDLGAQVISRLFKLPLSYFETRPTGQTVARVREIETIRTFLTGQASTSIVDVLFTLIFIAFLFSYSVKMTIVVICSIPVYLLVVFGIRPLLRDKTKEKFSRGALSQQYLVESIVGASTVKAAAIEPLVQQQWEERLAAYVKSSFQSVMLSNLGQVLIQFVSKITTASVLYFGAEAVMAGNLTVGQLVAFNMLSGQLVQPIIRLSQLWQDIQQIQISVDRIGDIFNAAQEEHASSMAQIPRDPIHGAIRLQNVSFRYTEGTPDVLSEFSLDIPAGQVIGIVGPSGSGKSTLTKLIQRLYVPRQGKVSIDGFDIAHVHSAWFRRQMGVVLQENLLFNRSLHENIAIANPGMPRDRVASIAKLAGADEFIREMPMGYATQIEERGANLSGGQRQRIAIARALARNPRILILDEATSALDYESERIIQENMRQIVQGRTVIIVAHRLAAVRDCDRIISVDKGRIVEDGTHDELLRNENGLYANLWSLQRAAK